MPIRTYTSRRLGGSKPYSTRREDATRLRFLGVGRRLFSSSRLFPALLPGPLALPCHHFDNHQRHGFRVTSNPKVLRRHDLSHRDRLLFACFRAHPKCCPLCIHQTSSSSTLLPVGLRSSIFDQHAIRTPYNLALVMRSLGTVPRVVSPRLTCVASTLPECRLPSGYHSTLSRRTIRIFFPSWLQSIMLISLG